MQKEFSMRKKWNFFVFFFCFLAAATVSFAGCSEKRNADSPTDDAVSPNANAAVKNDVSAEKKAAEIVEIQSEQAFLDLVDGSEIAIIDFNADWCGPCQKLFPELEKIAVDYKAEGLKVGSVNIDENSFVEQFNIQGIPDVRIYVDGQVVQRVLGFDVPKLKSGVENALKLKKARTSFASPQLTSDSKTESPEIGAEPSAEPEPTAPLEDELWPEDAKAEK